MQLKKNGCLSAILGDEVELLDSVQRDVLQRPIDRDIDGALGRPVLVGHTAADTFFDAKVIVPKIGIDLTEDGLPARFFGATDCIVDPKFLGR